MKTYPLYLNNEWLTTEATFSVSNPATGEAFARISTVGRDRVSQALKDAHAAFLNWRKQTGKARGEFLHLNRGPTLPAFAPGFKCRIRDLIAKVFCI